METLTEKKLKRKLKRKLNKINRTLKEWDLSVNAIIWIVALFLLLKTVFK